MNAKFLITFACCAAATTALQGQVSLLSAPTKIKGVAFPIYLQAPSELAAVVRCERIFTDYQRKGFFRIGLLPVIVAEGVKLELHSSARVTQALAASEGWLKPPGSGRAVELRRVVFVFTNEITPRVTAGRVRFGENGQWQLLDGVRVQTTTNELRCASALLQTTGGRAGQLAWPSGTSAAAMNLFDSQFASDNSTPKPK